MIEVSIGSVLTKIRRAGKLKNADYQTSGRYPVIDQGEGQVGGYSNDESLVHFSPLPIVIFGDHTRRVKLAKEPFICGADGTQLLYPAEDFDPIYFFYAVKNVDLSNYHYARHFKFLKDQNIIKHDRSTQQKIAGILATYDDLIENNLKRIKLLEEMAQITYEEWFVRLRFPGHESAPINPETGLPEGWKRAKLKEVLVLNYGKALKADTRLEGHVPVYGSSGIVGTHNEALVEGCGIIVGRKGNVGSVFWSHDSFYPIDTVYFVTSTHTLPFLYLALKNSRFNNSDAAVPGLNRDAAYAVEIMVPPEVLEKQFSVSVQQNLKAIQLLEIQNQHLREARDILLPRLMTGMIDVDQYHPENLIKDAA